MAIPDARKKTVMPQSKSVVDGSVNVADLNLLSDAYLSVMDLWLLGWYKSSDPSTFPACRGGNMTCQAISIDRLVADAQRTAKYAGRRARFFLWVVRKAWRRLERRLVKDAIRKAVLAPGETMPKAEELHLMITRTDASSAPQLMIGRFATDGGGRVSYPDALAPILAGREGSVHHVPEPGHQHHG